MAIAKNTPRGEAHGMVPAPQWSLPAGNIHWYEGEVVGQDPSTGILRPLVPGLSPVGWVNGAEIDYSAESNGGKRIMVRSGYAILPQDGTLVPDLAIGLTPVYWDPSTNRCTSSDLGGTAAYLGALVKCETTSAVVVLIQPDMAALAQQGGTLEMVATIGYAQLVAAGAAATVTIAIGALPPKARYLGASIGGATATEFTAFAGGSVSAAKLAVGGTTVNGLINNCDVFTGATGFPKNAGGTAAGQATPYVYQLGGQTMNATFTLTGDTADHLTAGSIRIRLFFAPLA